MDDHTPGAELLKGWREREARSQTEIAAALDIRQNTVSEWEKGSRRPDLTNALRLESHTKRAVPAVAWGYTDDECRKVLAAMVDVAASRDTDDAAEAP